MKFVLDTFWLTKDRLPYISRAADETLVAEYSISRVGYYEELSILTGSYGSGYTHDAMIEYICQKHGVDMKSAEITLQNGGWTFYRIYGYDWEKHQKWAKPFIEKERINQLEEELAEYSSADLEKILRRRKNRHE